MRTHPLIYIAVAQSLICSAYCFTFTNNNLYSFDFLILGPLFLLLPNILYRFTRIAETASPKFYTILGWIFLLGFEMEVIRGPFLRTSGLNFDSLQHFINGIIVSAVFGLLYLVIQKTYFEKDVSAQRTALVVFGIMFFISFAWEGVEWLVDIILGTEVFGDPVKSIVFDTTTDIALTLLGASIGSWLVYKKFLYWKDKVLK